MHELSIAQALIEQLDEVATREGASEVLSVTLRVGSLSGADPDALSMAFPMAAEDTVAQGAQLIIENVPARVECRGCSLESSPEFPFLACENCGSNDVICLEGKELTLCSVELNVEEKDSGT